MSARTDPRPPQEPAGAVRETGGGRTPGWRAFDAALPLLSLACAVALWELVVRWRDIPAYLLPAPTDVARALQADFGSLAQSWWITVRTTFAALGLAIGSGVLLGALFVLLPRTERVFLPFAVVLQVTPIVAIAPYILILSDNDPALTMLLCAWLAAFFPILSNVVVGLRAADPALRDLMHLYGATRAQMLRHLLLPAALPDFLAGLKIASGLSLVGTVVAELAAGAAGQQTGLASRIVEAGFRTQIPKMFAALVLVSLTGWLMWLLFGALSSRLLAGWHASARVRG